jgi:hypothetical protein
MSNLPTPYEATAVPTAQQVLDLTLPSNDAGAVTIRGYLIQLLRKLWAEGSGGSDDWQWDIYDVMVKAGWVTGLVDEDGFLVSVDTATADKYLDAAIQELGRE